MKNKILAGEMHELPDILRALPGAWKDAYTTYAEMKAQRTQEARREAEQEKEDARWEAQAISLDWRAMPPSRKLAGKQVWLYHGTTSAQLPMIEEKGLVPGMEVRKKRLLGVKSNISTKGDSVRYQPHVFLTANNDGGPSSALWYARQAAHVHGGDPMVLRVMVDWDDLASDPDDQDIPSGRYQFVIDRVAPSQIMEIDGVRRTVRSNPARRSTQKSRGV
jgi:hypothetical protein